MSNNARLVFSELLLVNLGFAFYECFIGQELPLLKTDSTSMIFPDHLLMERMISPILSDLRSAFKSSMAT